MGVFDFFKINNDTKNKKFDVIKVEWQYDSALKAYCKEMKKKAKDLDDDDYDIIWEYAADYIGILLTWLISNDYFVDVSNKFKSDINLVKRERMTGTEFLLNNLDGTLKRENISEEIIDFIDFYFDLYVKDFCGIMKVDYQKSCYTTFDWQEYDAIVEIVNSRLEEYKAFHYEEHEEKSKNSKKIGFINPENNLLEYKDEGIDIFDDNLDTNTESNEKEDSFDDESNKDIDEISENTDDVAVQEKYEDVEIHEPVYEEPIKEDEHEESMFESVKRDLEARNENNLVDVKEVQENKAEVKEKPQGEESLYEATMSDQDVFSKIDEEVIEAKMKKRTNKGRHSINYEKTNPVDDVVNALVEELTENNNFEHNDYVEVPYVEEKDPYFDQDATEDSNKKNSNDHKSKAKKKPEYSESRKKNRHKAKSSKSKSSDDLKDEEVEDKEELEETEVVKEVAEVVETEEVESNEVNEVETIDTVAEEPQEEISEETADVIEQEEIVEEDNDIEVEDEASQDEVVAQETTEEVIEENNSKIVENESIDENEILLSMQDDELFNMVSDVVVKHNIDIENCDEEAIQKIYHELKIILGDTSIIEITEVGDMINSLRPKSAESNRKDIIIPVPKDSTVVSDKPNEKASEVVTPIVHNNVEDKVEEHEEIEEQPILKKVDKKSKFKKKDSNEKESRKKKKKHSSKK